jgi:hypothetical protein
MMLVSSAGDDSLGADASGAVTADAASNPTHGKKLAMLPLPASSVPVGRRATRRILLAISWRDRHKLLVVKLRGVLSGLILVVGCGSSEGPSSASNGGSSAGGGSAGEAQSQCPPGAGAWASQSPDYFASARAQYARCDTLCQSARDASCAGHDYDACVDYCNALQNNAINGRCTEAVGALIDCFEALADPCSTPKRSSADKCASQRDDLRCCLARYCADPVNVGRCP